MEVEIEKSPGNGLPGMKIFLVKQGMRFFGDKDSLPEKESGTLQE